MANKPKFTARQFIDAVPGTGGVISTISARVGCHRDTACAYIRKYATIAQAVANEEKAIDDKAKSNVIRDIADGSIETSKWWLRVKMPEEFAPGTKVEHSGKIDVTKLSDVELDEYIESLS